VANVFISYSRPEYEFARRLRDALAQNQHEPWIDDEGIPGGARFLDVILPALERADVIIVVLSPAWLTSEHCRKELDTAASFNKRIVPVECNSEQLRDRPPGLDGLSPVAFWRSTFESSLGKLLVAIAADIEWLKQHGELLVYARRWEESGRSDIRLRGDALRRAVQAVARADAGARPDLTTLQREYIVACERQEAAETERLTLLNRRAVARHLLAEAQLVRSRDPGAVDVALRLALESVRRAPSGGARTLVRELTHLMRRVSVTLTGTVRARIIRFSRSGTLVAVGCADGVARVYSAQDGAPVLEVPSGGGVVDLAFDGSAYLVSIGSDGFVRRTDLRSRTCETRAVKVPASARVSADGRTLVTLKLRESSTILVHDLTTPGAQPLEVCLPGGSTQQARVQDLAVSATGHWVIAVCATLVPQRESPAPVVSLLNTRTEQVHELWSGHAYDFMFSPSEKHATARVAGGTAIWRTSDRHLRKSLPGDVRAWALDDERCLFVLEPGRRTDDPSSPRYHVNLASAEGHVQLHLGRFPQVRSGICFRHARREVFGVSSGRVAHLFDGRVGTELAVLPHDGNVCALEASPDGATLASASDQEDVRLWALSVEKTTLGPFVASVATIAVSHHGSVIAYALDCSPETTLISATLANSFEDGDITHRLEPCAKADAAGKCEKLIVARTGTLVAIMAPWTIVSSRGSAQRGDHALVVATGESSVTLDPGTRVLDATIADDGGFLAKIGPDCAAALASLETLPEITWRQLDMAGAERLAFDRTGERLGVSGPSGLKVFSTATAECIEHLSDVVAWTFSRDATSLYALRSNGELRSTARRARAASCSESSPSRSTQGRTIDTSPWWLATTCCWSTRRLGRKRAYSPTSRPSVRAVPP
jgi:WD40 repeat protein